MAADQAKATRYPLLETILAHRGLPLKGTYTVRDAADLFGVSPRTIQVKVKGGKLRVRDLPGRAKFLSIDLEEYLQSSLRQVDRSS